MTANIGVLSMTSDPRGAIPEELRFGPLMMGSDVLGERWNPLIVRELLLGATRFNDIARGLPGISRSLLVQRFKRLERDGVLLRLPSPVGRGYEYHLTPAGRAVAPVVAALGRWVLDWQLARLDPPRADAAQVTSALGRLLTAAELPMSRMVIEVDHTDPVRAWFWLFVDRGSASLCTAPPGFDTDIWLTATTPALAEVVEGETTWTDAVANGDITVNGPASLVRFLTLCVEAPVVAH